MVGIRTKACVSATTSSRLDSMRLSRLSLFIAAVYVNPAFLSSRRIRMPDATRTSKVTARLILLPWKAAVSPAAQSAALAPGITVALKPFQNVVGFNSQLAGSLGRCNRANTAAA